MSALLEVKHADISFGGIHAVKDLRQYRTEK